MKRFLPFLLLIFILAACEKTVEKAQEKAVINAMTSGYWTVTKFTRGTTEQQSAFSAYKFQFKENNTVDAYKSNSLDKSGAWQGDVVAMTIFSDFGNVSEPLSLLNGTWKITNNSWTFVEATITVNGETRLLRLDKQ